jgi:cell wall-associated NlpC family hydrolase
VARAIAVLAALLALGALAAGCGGPPPATPPGAAPPALKSAPPGTGRQITVDALAYVGTPYRRGGMDASGMDCSGLVGRVYLDRGYPLPRTAEEIAAAGAPVSRDDLRPGDIVVFAIAGDRPSHVGIYVGDGSFVHAPGRGDRVRESDLGSDYFRPRFRGGRRLLSE